MCIAPVSSTVLHSATSSTVVLEECRTKEVMAGANNASGAANGDESMAHSVQERLEESGERARMKEWLYEALENGGWTAAMDKHAGQYVAGRMRNGGDKDVTPSVEQIADNIMGKGFGALARYSAICMLADLSR